MADNIDSWKWIHQQLTDQIDREFELLGQRMNWLLTSNAFLLTVTAISIGASDSSKFYTLAPVLMCGAAILGTIICFLSYFVMKAARQAIIERKMNRETYEVKIRAEYEFDFHITVPTDVGHFVGNSPNYILPISISFIWLIVLYQVASKFV